MDSDDIKVIHAYFSTNEQWNCAGECAYLRTRLIEAQKAIEALRKELQDAKRG